MGWHMECPSCRHRIAVWKMRYRRVCPACGARLRNELTLRGWLILIAFLGIAGAGDYLHKSRCGISAVCNSSALTYIHGEYTLAKCGLRGTRLSASGT